jgi:hypothetical protein
VCIGCWGRRERRIGQLLRDREMAKGTRGQLAGGSTLRPPETAQPLADLTISKTPVMDNCFYDIEFKRLVRVASANPRSLLRLFS